MQRTFDDAGAVTCAEKSNGATQRRSQGAPPARAPGSSIRSRRSSGCSVVTRSPIVAWPRMPRKCKLCLPVKSVDGAPAVVAGNRVMSLQKLANRSKRFNCGATHRHVPPVAATTPEIPASVWVVQIFPREESQTESVTVDTHDNFCTTNTIRIYRYLKIDAEGGDLEVFWAAVTMLSAQRIDITHLNSGPNPTNRRLIPFEAIKGILESYMHYLSGIHEQANEWPAGDSHLRRANPIFLSQHLIKNTGRTEERGNRNRGMLDPALFVCCKNMSTR